MTSFHSCRTSSTSMQQCAQCSKSAATSSAQRIVSAGELELPWLPLLAATFCATAAAPAKTRRAVRNRHTVEQQRSLHGVSTPTASTSASLFVPSPLSGSHDRPTPSTSKKHQQHHARHSSQRGITTSARSNREASTQSQKSINTPYAPPSSSSTSNKPVNSDPYVKSFERPSGTPSSSSSDFQITQSSDTPSSSRPKSSAPSSASNPLSAGHLQYLNEDVVQSTSEGTKQAKDEINTLLSYPTLYDPIRKPRNPIVLCHGLYGFDTWGLELLPALKVHYWADVLQVLKGVVGVDPFVVGVPGTGAITERAKQMHSVLRNDQKLRGKDVNLIGHSMGGLDCRHLLTHIRPQEYNPVSLTTLATPHRGSPFMAWCRANIGIGDIAKAAEEASKEFSSSSSKSSSTEVNLPYSLKTPIFSRSKWQESNNNKSSKDLDALEETKAAARQAVRDASSALQDEAKSKKAAITKTVINLPGLNYSLGTSLASYLLDLLDSPAYSNLTSDYLESTFNPNTPDRPDVRYFSIAARTPKLPITHPLWLPKLIVDKAQELEKAKALQNGNKKDNIQWGNDGLVPVESAKWGEFLGILENADHWSIRGGAGFTTEPKGKKNATQTPTTTPEAEKKSVVDKSAKDGDSGKEAVSNKNPDTSKEEEQNGEQSELESLGEKAKAAVSAVVDIAAPVTEATTKVLPSFDWSDINTAVFKGIDARDRKDSSSPGPAEEAKSAKDNKDAATTVPSTTNGNKDALKTLSSIAGWIVKRIPLPTSNKSQLRSSIDPAYPLDDTTLTKPASDPPANTPPAKTPSTVTNAARLLFGSSSSSKSNSKSSNGDSTKFNHERFYVALCKKLYDEGF